MIVHDAVVNEGDLWSWMVDELSREIDRRMEHLDEPIEGVSSTSAMAGLLGRRTAQLHRALATIERSDPSEGDFTPQPFTLLWQRSLLQNLRSGLKSTQRSLRARQPGERRTGRGHVVAARRT